MKKISKLYIIYKKMKADVMKVSNKKLQGKLCNDTS